MALDHRIPVSDAVKSKLYDLKGPNRTYDEALREVLDIEESEGEIEA